jgi:hypothetical protein
MGADALEQEPNDSIGSPDLMYQTFRSLGSGRYQLGLRAALGAAGDEDWYNLGRLRFGRLTASASGSGSSRGTAADARLRLYRDGGAGLVEVASDDDSGPGADAELSAGLAADATYYLVVDRGPGAAPADAGGTYDLGVWLDGTAPGTGAAVRAEAEPNDRAADANDLSRAWRAVGWVSQFHGDFAGAPFRWTGTEGDVDYFAYDFNAGDVVDGPRQPPRCPGGPRRHRPPRRVAHRPA